jgi:hypothetical protein
VIATYDVQSLRDDLVGKYHRFLVRQASLDTFGEELSPTSGLLSELTRLQMVGAWREGAHLHFANSLSGAEDAAEAAGQLGEWRDSIIALIRPAGQRYPDSASRCVLGSIDDLFDSLTLHGASEATVVIPLKRRLKIE